ncbi:hypothetical protein [Streptomyces sp. NPDC002082]|uniref:hypothetical protein n=1 Tax=Streptomyces sp. NPDC002082 TaxID=3154772 RepID=UPI0033235E98
MAENTEDQRKAREQLDRLASEYLVDAAKHCATVPLGAMVVVAVVGAIFSDYDNPDHVRVVATIMLGVGVLGVLGVWTGSPSRRLRQIRQSRTRAARFIRAHLAGRTVRTRTEIRGCKVYLTRELKDELKSRWWWQSDSRIDAALEAAADNTPLAPVLRLRWCEAKTFAAEAAEPVGPLLFVRWSLADSGNIVVIGHAGPSASGPEGQPGSEPAPEEFEEGYTPERWLNGDRIASGIAMVVLLLAVVAFVVFVLPALLIVGLTLIATAGGGALLVGGYGRSKRR